MSTQAERLQDLVSGDMGGNFIANTTPVTGHWYAIHAITETTFTTLESSNITGTLNAITLAAGAVLHGHFNAITLATGSVIAYTRPGGRWA